jgi:hypothetical protein
MTAPLQVSLDGDTLILSCYLPDCRREVGRFTIDRNGSKADLLAACEKAIAAWPGSEVDELRAAIAKAKGQ